MPANLLYHEPIGVVETTSGLTPFTASVAEKAGQTFHIGVPVQVNAGYVQQWDGVTIVAGIAGFSLTYGLNLGTNGMGAPGAFSQIGPPGAIQTYGSVPNQPAAFNIAVGTPISDGRTLFESSIGLNIFEANFDDSTGAVAADYTPTQAEIGTQFGLTMDASGQWYVDGGKITPGTNTVVVMVGINPIDLVPGGAPLTYIINARVRFQVIATARQLYI
jgi:hypothetical protein